MRKIIGAALFAALAAIGLVALPGDAADHLDAPLVKQDGRTDINDIYLFTSPRPKDGSDAVLAMTVDPVAGVQSPETFAPGQPYVFEIDTNGDALSDSRIVVTFAGPDRRGEQNFVLTGPGITADGRTGRDVAVHDATTLRKVGMVRADVFDDPFFFDLAAFRNGLQFCPGGVGTNFFAGLNVAAIVIEVPKPVLTGGGDSTTGVWARTLDGGFEQLDRMGRPAINTVFNQTDADKDAFNAGAPADDQANFRTNVVNTLLALGNDTATANALADFLLPDILTADLSQPTVFPNGRGLPDDVIDTELGLITGGAVPSDCVGNDSDFRKHFPYLARAN
jgi:hypothetical protein